MTFTQAISSVLSNYVGFSGRAARSEYWYWVLFYTLVLVVAVLIDQMVLGFAALQTIVSLAFLLPSIAVAIRRLHDLDRSGWWLLLALIPIVNIVLIVWYCFKGTAGPNRFGPDPVAFG